MLIFLYAYLFPQMTSLSIFEGQRVNSPKNKGPTKLPIKTASSKGSMYTLFVFSIPMTDPWDWYIYLHLVDLYGINVGKYTSPMDPSWD